MNEGEVDEAIGFGRAVIDPAYGIIGQAAGKTRDVDRMMSQMAVVAAIARKIAGHFLEGDDVGAFDACRDAVKVEFLVAAVPYWILWVTSSFRPRDDKAARDLVRKTADPSLALSRAMR